MIIFFFPDWEKGGGRRFSNSELNEADNACLACGFTLLSRVKMINPILIIKKIYDR